MVWLNIWRTRLRLRFFSTTDHQNDAFEGDVLGLGFDWKSDSVGFEEGGVYDSKVVVWWMVSEGIYGGANGGRGRIDDQD